ncbi:MAG: hypothetical protein WD872_16815 [Pirellulaceae bacterium]
MYKTGDRVVYVASKHSLRPGPRAEALTPEPHGEGYSYDVKKYWLVLEAKPDGTLTVVTRRGKQRVVPASDPRLRPARWWENIFLASRFPQPEDGDHNEPGFRRSAALR